MLKDEQKAISKFISDSGFVVLTEYPKDKVFQSNEFLKLPNGLYMNVIDSGKEKIDSFSVVLYRYKSFRSLFDTITYAGNWYDYSPSEFVYGPAPSSSNGQIEGLATPLSFVGNQAKVKLIIPSALNSYSIMNSVTPYYYDCIKYEKSIY